MLAFCGTLQLPPLCFRIGPQPMVRMSENVDSEATRDPDAAASLNARKAARESESYAAFIAKHGDPDARPRPASGFRAAARNQGKKLLERFERTEPPLTAEGFARIRERQRLRANGAPMKEWAELSDREVDDVQYKPVPPTTGQAAAANELFESMLTDATPKGFGDGLEHFFEGDRASWEGTPGAANFTKTGWS